MEQQGQALSEKALIALQRMIFSVFHMSLLWEEFNRAEGLDLLYTHKNRILNYLFYVNQLQNNKTMT